MLILFTWHSILHLFILWLQGEGMPSREKSSRSDNIISKLTQDTFTFGQEREKGKKRKPETLGVFPSAIEYINKDINNISTLRKVRIICSFSKNIFNIKPMLHHHKNFENVILCLVTSGHLQEKVEINIFLFIPTYYFYILISVVIATLANNIQNIRNRPECEAAGAEEIFTVYTPVGFTLNVCGPMD